MQSMTLDWLNIAALLGAAQGFFLAGVLATQRRNRTANRLLAVAVLAFSIQMITVVYHAVELEQVFPHFFGVAFPLPLIYGPLIYLYTVCTSDRARRLLSWDALHFVPFVVIMLAGLPIYLMSGAEKIEFYHQLQQGVRPSLVRVTDVLKYASGISYTAVTLLFLRQHRTRVKDSYSSIERVNLQWLLHLVWGAAVIWVAAAVFHVTETAGHPLLERPDDVVALATAILVYGIGYRALRQPEVFNVATGEFPVVPGLASGATPNLEAATATMPDSAAARRYERSGLGDTEAAVLKDALRHAMDNDRHYRSPDLTLPELATHLGTTPHKLSEVLNSQLNQSFYDFVNGHRVREVQRRLADDRSDALTLLSLALDAGFASKSTFNSVFKRYTGQTPSDYRRSLKSEKGSAAPDA
jgi:AraC-like DNA-binding protein